MEYFSVFLKLIILSHSIPPRRFKYPVSVCASASRLLWHWAVCSARKCTWCCSSHTRMCAQERVSAEEAVERVAETAAITTINKSSHKHPSSGTRVSKSRRCTWRVRAGALHLALPAVRVEVGCLRASRWILYRSSHSNRQLQL